MELGVQPRYKEEGLQSEKCWVNLIIISLVITFSVNFNMVITLIFFGVPIFAISGTGDAEMQNGWIFGKDPEKGGGRHIQSKNLISENSSVLVPSSVP